MLPHPDLSFTLPSIHDGTKLDCRVYHPHNYNSGEGGRGWNGDVAVVAHPYAPLGGCYDDHVVDVVAGTLLGNGFLVATFNFRGAATSAGRTSWTSKPEQDDYVTIAGFLAYYAHYLHGTPRESNSPDSNAASDPSPPTPTFLFAGYSYGAIIVTRLPPAELVLSHFETPVIHTPAADIRLRAQHLGEQQRGLWVLSLNSPRSSLGMRIGGEDSANHGEEKIKRGVRDLLQRSKIVLRKKDSHKEKGTEDTETEQCLERLDDIRFRAAYLLVSPPVGIVTNLATMSFGKSGNGVLGGMFGDFGRDGVEERDGKFVRNDTLCVYGGQDGFISNRKIRDWSKRLTNSEASRWRAVEVAGAGHFWVEVGVMSSLRDALDTFANEVVGRGETRL